MLFSRTRLPSGLRVLTERMPEVRSVSVGFWIGVGSRDEPEDLYGAAHFLEHLLFKGTDTRSARSIAEAFDAVGAEANAFATREYSCVYARMLDDDLPDVIECLADMIRNPSLREDDIDSERRVILDEIANLEDSAEDLVHEIFMQMVLGSHPLAREVMGSADSVRTIPFEGVRQFHEQNYRASNIVVAAAGSVGHDETVAAVSKWFEGDASALNERARVFPESSGRLQVLHRPTEQAHLVIGGLGYPRRHADRFAWGVLDILLGGGVSSRLFQEVREERGLAYSVFSYRSAFSDAGLWAVYAGTAPSNVVEVGKIICDQLDQLVDDGITEEELERAKGHMRGGAVISLEDSGSRMNRLGKSDLTDEKILSIDEIIERIDAVSLEEVNRVSKDLFGRKDRALTAIGPVEEAALAELI